MTTQRSTPVRLSDAQRTILAAAGQRADTSLILPARLKGNAAGKLARALLDKGLVRETRAKGDQPVWRKDEGTGRGFALVLTKAGRTCSATPDAPEQRQATPSDAASSSSAPAVSHQGGKRDSVVALLGREQGATVAELMAATGWLPHTTRAALSRLRSGGQALAKTTRQDGVTSYRLLPPKAAARTSAVPEPQADAELAA